MGNPPETDQQGQTDDNATHEAAMWFAQLLDPATPQSDYGRFREWLHADDRNAKAYARMESLWGQSAAEPKQSDGLHPRRGFLKAIGGVALLVGGGTVAWTVVERPDFSTGKAEIRSFRLPDGSTAQLSPGSAISLDFGGTTRRVTLHRGEAYFAVEADAGRPFVVEAGSLSATALGTAYSVSLMPEKTSVTVAQHSVRVEVGGHNLELREGEAVDYRDGVLGSVVHDEVEGRLGWRSRQLVFLARPLGEIVAEINRWRAGRLVVLDPVLADRRVTAILDVSDIAGIDRSLQQGLPITLTSYTPLLTIVTAKR